MIETDAVRDRLQARMKVLAKRVESAEEELRAPVSASFEEQATEREGDEVLEDLEQAALAEMAAIRVALKRLEDGIYGECASCGTDIAEARLNLLPHTSVCVDCAAAAEKAG